MPQGQAPRSFRRLTQAFLAVTASFSMVVAVIGAFGFFTYIRWNHIGQQCFGDCPASRTSSGTASSPDALAQEAIGPCASESCNYLLLGSDSRTGLSSAQIAHNGTTASIGGQRSDTIMLVHTEPGGRTVVLSFPRDLWVEIPGHGYNKEGHPDPLPGLILHEHEPPACGRSLELNTPAPFVVVVGHQLRGFWQQ